MKNNSKLCFATLAMTLVYTAGVNANECWQVQNTGSYPTQPVTPPVCREISKDDLGSQCYELKNDDLTVSSTKSADVWVTNKDIPLDGVSGGANPQPNTCKLIPGLFDQKALTIAAATGDTLNVSIAGITPAGGVLMTAIKDGADYVGFHSAKPFTYDSDKTKKLNLYLFLRRKMPKDTTKVDLPKYVYAQAFTTDKSCTAMVPKLGKTLVAEACPSLTGTSTVKTANPGRTKPRPGPGGNGIYRQQTGVGGGGEGH